MSWVGRKLIIKKDGVPIAGARAKSVRFNNEPINVSHEEEDGFRHLLDVLDTREVMLSIEGVLSGPHAEQLIRPKVEGELIDVEVEFPDESTLSADDGAYIHSLQITGEYRNAAMFAASLVLNGRFVPPDEPPPAPLEVGRIWGWGTDGSAQLQFPLVGSPPARQGSAVPMETTLGSEDWDQAATGQNFSFGIRQGRLYAWGANSNGRTGLGVSTGITETPTQVGTDEDWTAISAGDSHTLGIRGGRLYAWGNNANFMTGLGTSTGSTLSPTQVGTDTDWTAVSCGLNYSLGIRGGLLHAWGANNFGQTGLNTATGSTGTPAQASAAAGFTKVFACGTHSLAIREGLLYSWGWNSGYRTGLGTNSGNTLIPQTASGFDGWTDIAGGIDYSIAIRNGVLHGCGVNGNGAVGFPNGTFQIQTFLPIGTETDWLQVEASYFLSASYGRRAGRLYAWGTYNANNSIGLGLPGPGAPVWGPTQIGSFEDWVKVFSSRGGHTLAIRAP